MKGIYPSGLQTVGVVVHLLPFVFAPLGAICVAVLWWGALHPTMPWRVAAVVLGFLFAGVYALKWFYDRPSASLDTDLMLTLSGAAFLLLAVAAVVKVLAVAAARLR